MKENDSEKVTHKNIREEICYILNIRLIIVLSEMLIVLIFKQEKLKPL